MDEKLLFTPALSSRYHAEADGLGYWMVVTTRSGLQTIRTGCDKPMPEQEMFCRDMGRVLNRHLHHDGAWIVGLVDPKPELTIDLSGAGRDYDRALMIWVDEDGDPQFTVEIEDLWWRILAKGPDHWIEKAETAWRRWHHHMREVLEPKNGETYKRAQGEAPPSQRN